MKIAIDALRNRSGGAEAYFVNVVSRLKPEEFGVTEVHLWAPEKLLERLPKNELFYLHTPPKFPRFGFLEVLWQWVTLPKLLSGLEIDVLFSTDATSLARYPRQVVLSQDLLAYEGKEMWKKSFPFGILRQLAIRSIQRNSLRSATASIFLTRYAAGLFQERFGFVKHAIIPHGQDRILPLKFREPPETGRWKLLYVSPLSPHKNHNSVIRALGNVSRRGVDFEITFIGNGKQRVKNRLFSLGLELGLSADQMHFLGHLSPEEVDSRLDETDIFVFASSAESFGITLLEAMSKGIPIACSALSSLPETLRDGGVYFDPRNPTSIATSLETLILSGDTRRRVSERCHHLAQLYSWEVVANSTFDLLREVGEPNKT